MTNEPSSNVHKQRRGCQSRSTKPEVNSRVQYFFPLWQHPAHFHHHQHNVVQAARQPANKERNEVLQRTAFIENPNRANAPSEYNMMEVIRKADPETQSRDHVVDVKSGNHVDGLDTVVNSGLTFSAKQ